MLVVVVVVVLVVVVLVLCWCRKLEELGQHKMCCSLYRRCTGSTHMTCGHTYIHVWYLRRLI